jgi:hypothetical protein
MSITGEADAADDAIESESWGHCTHCKFFGRGDGFAESRELAERRCHEPELAAFDLVVTGSCGCSHFQRALGVPETIEEPSHPPPVH